MVIFLREHDRKKWRLTKLFHKLSIKVSINQMLVGSLHAKIFNLLSFSSWPFAGLVAQMKQGL